MGATMGSREKGARREQQAMSIYKAAGYRVEHATQAHYGAGADFFGLADLLALSVHAGHLRVVQVKSNQAQGIREWFSEAERIFPPEVELDFIVCHDREGWRLLRPAKDMTYVNVLDERKNDGNMGDTLEAWLREQVASDG